MLTLPGKATGIIVTLCVASCLLVAGSSDAGKAPALRAKARALDHRMHEALLELYALETSLARARADSARVRATLDDVTRRAAALERRVAVVKRSLAVARSRVADVIRQLYVEGHADPIALVLGATSIDEAITAIDSLRYAATRNRALVGDLKAGSVRMRVLHRQLGAERRELEASRARVERAEHVLQERVADRTAFVAVLRREWRLTHARISALENRVRVATRTAARFAVTRSEGIAADETSRARDGVVVATRRVRQLVVESVAYHLRGTTASGLPVGPGVVAVDPAVIPLGTRIHVPGYGPAVAADVGSAIKGNVIDLWFATTGHALAWGRRTITITIYGAP